MPTVQAKCDWCGIEFPKLACEMSAHNFCCKAHFHLWNGKRMAEYNRTENRKNKAEGWTEEEKGRSREKRLGASIRGYRKYHQRHEHRVVAAEMLGRELLPGEVVHHIDGDKSNNSPSNLQVMTQSEHAKIHAIAARAAKGVG